MADPLFKCSRCYRQPCECKAMAVLPTATGLPKPTRCPKCGGVDISGPQYRRPTSAMFRGEPIIGREEHMEWECDNCSYPMTLPCVPGLED